MIVMESNGPLSQHISRTTKYWLSYITFDVYALNVLPMTQSRSGVLVSRLLLLDCLSMTLPNVSDMEFRSVSIP